MFSSTDAAGQEANFFTPLASQPRDWRALRYMAILLAVAVVTRGPLYGNPVSHVDDQFYLLVGRSMLHGELPYVDLWDRKPIGLFLIYAAIASLGGNAVIMVQLFATIFATATAYFIASIGNRLAAHPGGLLAGIVYLFMLPTLSGAGGQSPIFYNLPMAIAGLITLRAVQGSSKGGARAAMMLVGLAMAIKPVAMFEGIWFAIVFLTIEWRRSSSWRNVVLAALPMMAMALLPTVAAFATYAAIGHLGEIWSATVVSVIGKAPLPHRQIIVLLGFMLLILALPLASAATSLALLARSNRAACWFMLGWIVAAGAGVASVPNFFDHYALPFLVPLCAVTARLLSPRLIGLAWAGALILWATTLTRNALRYDGFARAKKFERVVALVQRNLHGGCLYVYEGPVQLYNSTGACRVTRFVFPDHLNSAIEAHALPVDQLDEIERIFARRPAVVVDTPRIFLEESTRSRTMLRRQLECNYRRLGTVSDTGTFFYQPLTIWTMRDDWRPCPSLPLAIRT
jgi:hypothetical protein